jgi:hypothetical protein
MRIMLAGLVLLWAQPVWADTDAYYEHERDKWRMENEASDLAQCLAHAGNYADINDALYVCMRHQGYPDRRPARHN